MRINVMKWLSVVPVAAGLAFAGWSQPAPAPAAPAAQAPHVAARSQIEAGRYLVVIQGCNDCHTAGWEMNPGKVPESQWLTGNPVGFKGPWGTSYGFNLRNYFARTPVDKWVTDARKLNGAPPMPNHSVRMMSESDLRAMHAFIYSLGPVKAPPLRSLKPGQEPTGPYVDMTPRNLPSGAPTEAPPK